MVLPAFRPPQLATLADQVPTGDGWLFEMKFDGYRCQAAIAGDQVTLYTRRGHDWSQQFRFVLPPLRTLTKGTLLIDGEICAINAQSRTNFSLLKISFAAGAPLVFYVFDLLERDGEDIARLPQLERKERLEKVVGAQVPTSPLQFSHHVQGHGDQVFRGMCEGGHEGVSQSAPMLPIARAIGPCNGSRSSASSGKNSSSSVGGRPRKAAKECGP